MVFGGSQQDITQPAMEQDGEVSEIIKTAGTFFVLIWSFG